MALSRNERRKLAKHRAVEKSTRIANASEAARLQANRKIVQANLSSPIERIYPVRSCLDGIDGMSHRGYVCRAAGAGPKKR